MRSWKCTIITVLIILFSLAGSAAAHKVMVFAWVSGNTIQTESKFSGGRKVRAGKIEVFDPKGQLILSGKTNDQGEFSFPIPQSTTLKIVLTAGMGHRGEWTVSKDEIVNATPTNAASPAIKNTAGERVDSAAGAKKTVIRPAATETTMSANEIKEVVEKALDRKLEPVYRMLAESREHKPTITDVIGGIGYIIGLVGLVAYMHTRRQQQ
jgi:nickel transport protein